MNSHILLHDDIRKLRTNGLTYAEINKKLGTNISKSTLSYICRGIILTDKQMGRIYDILRESLVISRQKAVVANRKVFEDKLTEYRNRNQDIKKLMQVRQAKLIALAMLYLGEGAKWKSRRGLMLGSADPMIMKMYINLLRDCYGITCDRLKGRIQHRADQDPAKLVKYWSQVTGIEPKNFYPSYSDKRTIGKPTLQPDYRGVCVVTCGGTHVQLELEQIVGIINEAITGM